MTTDAGAAFAGFAASLELAAVPPDVAIRAKLLLLDSLGAALYGSTRPIVRQVKAVLMHTDREGDASVVGHPGRLACADAALVNGTAIQAFEIDDVGVYCHPSSTLVPALLATAEHSGDCTGERFLTALIAAYEIIVRIAASIGLGAEAEVGWHTPGFHGGIAAAAGSARVLGLPQAGIKSALGIAADLSTGGLMATRVAGWPLKPIHAGRGAATGVLAAQLAAQDVTVRDDVLQFEPWGYAWAITSYRGEGPKPWDFAPQLEDLGTRFDFLRSIDTKYYPATAQIQSVVDNVAALKSEHAFTAADVRRIEVGMAPFHHRATIPFASRTASSINFSPAYAVALAVRNEVRPLYETGEAVDLWVGSTEDPTIIDLASRVDEVVDESVANGNPYSVDTSVLVELADGSVLRRASAYVRDRVDPGDMAFDGMDADRIRQKFDNLLERTPYASVGSAIASLVLGIEEDPDISKLGRLLAAVR